MEEDRGIYICTGINGFGKAESRIELVVINPEDFPSISDTDISKLSEPVFSSETVRSTKDIIINPGASVSLLCSASGFPAPQLSWYKNNEHFRDSINLIGEEKLVSDYFSNKALSLVSVKCSPYHVADKAVILGDAAHAMVPFYGQGQ